MLFRGWDPDIPGDSRTRSGVYRKDTIIGIWIPKGILEKRLIGDLQRFIRVGTGKIRDSPSSSKGMRNPEDLVQYTQGVCSGTWLGIWIDWLGQCIMRLAPKLVPSNQLQEAELEMNRALGFGYLGKQVVERVWFKVAVERSVTKVLFMVCSTKEMAVGLGRSERLWYKFLASWSGLPIVGFTLVTGVLRFPDMGQMF
ncbi:hypothetical protein HID58_079367 [Brassica napus]|uniref:Uncharacterized protein n=1 Tax=Brassica napus TaxID=3708 RepID=A0ABQ7Y1U8_BRANA|nr:hypothetical protein HID58_079367 [Brassica napus]